MIVRSQILPSIWGEERKGRSEEGRDAKKIGWNDMYMQLYVSGLLSISCSNNLFKKKIGPKTKPKVN